MAVASSGYAGDHEGRPYKWNIIDQQAMQRQMKT
jgi:hypothetical protein